MPTDPEAAEPDSEVSGASTSLLPPGSYLRLRLRLRLSSESAGEPAIILASLSGVRQVITPWKPLQWHGHWHSRAAGQDRPGRSGLTGLSLLATGQCIAMCFTSFRVGQSRDYELAP